jgi:hypothetical protein
MTTGEQVKSQTVETVLKDVADGDLTMESRLILLLSVVRDQQDMIRQEQQANAAMVGTIAFFRELTGALAVILLGVCNAVESPIYVGTRPGALGTVEAAASFWEKRAPVPSPLDKSLRELDETLTRLGCPATNPPECAGPAPLPTTRELTGSDPDFTGDKSTKEFIDEIRG